MFTISCKVDDVLNDYNLTLSVKNSSFSQIPVIILAVCHSDFKLDISNPKHSNQRIYKGFLPKSVR